MPALSEVDFSPLMLSISSDMEKVLSTCTRRVDPDDLTDPRLTAAGGSFLRELG